MEIKAGSGLESWESMWRELEWRGKAEELESEGEGKETKVEEKFKVDFDIKSGKEGCQKSDSALGNEMSSKLIFLWC